MDLFRVFTEMFYKISVFTWEGFCSVQQMWVRFFSELSVLGSWYDKRATALSEQLQSVSFLRFDFSIFETLESHKSTQICSYQYVKILRLQNKFEWFWNWEKNSSKFGTRHFSAFKISNNAFLLYYDLKYIMGITCAKVFNT